MRSDIDNRIMYINHLLNTIHNVNKLITREKNQDQLLKKTCGCLSDTSCFLNCWIALLNENNQINSVYCASRDNNYIDMKQYITMKGLPYCARLALSKKEIVTIGNQDDTCHDCPLNSQHDDKGGIATILEHQHIVYGVLVVSAKSNYLKDNDIIALTKDVTGDIGYALYNLNMKQKHIQTKTALKLSEEKLELALEGANAGSWEMNVVDGSLFFGDHWVKHLGYSPGEFSYTIKDVEKFIHPDDVPKTYENLYMYLDGKTSIYENESRIRTKDGTYIWILSRGRIIEWDDTDKPVRLLGINFDITRLKKIEIALKKSEIKHRVLFENAGIGIGYYTTDGKIISYNNLAAEYLNGRPQDFEGKNIKEVFGKYGDLHFERLTKTAKTRQQYEYEDHVMLMNKITWYISIYTCIIDENDNVVGVQVVGKDITKRKNVESKLRENEERFRVFVEHSPASIMAIQDGKYVFANPAAARCLGYSSPEALIGVSIYDSIIPTYRNIVKKRAEIAKNGVKNEPFEIEVLRCDGTNLTVESTSVPITLDGKPGVLILGSDISDRKKAEAEIIKLNEELEDRVRIRTSELEFANKELKEFAYVVSHDLKAPLRAVSQLTSWILTDYNDVLDEPGKELLRMLIGRVKRMDALINGILEYSRIGRVHTEAEFIDLNDLVNNVIEMIDPPSSVQISIDHKLPELNIDKIRISQIFQNLISNAIKYNDKTTSKISISHKKLKTEWEFKISDNGPGIDKKYFDKIFKIFQTLKSKDEIESTGIGLSLVKKIVESYQGRIWVKSDIGKGSDFFFTLPIMHN